ncbi:MAG TPA: DNA translocase FtsK 4TM domain-containing protein [Xanthobacteraceae bacterium]|nr:DNA translocase FtsK 4TM domain-containing protein [Xanthobacteraceae bacterium]
MHRSFEADALLPEDLSAAIRRRVREITGIGLIALTGAAGAALATWSVKDPSLSHATSAPIRNVLGVPGAIAADLLMQLLGLGAVALLLPLAIWGWRLLTHRRFDRERLRIFLWVVGTLCAAAFASCLTRTAAWPLPTGLGGVIGDALLRLPAALVGGTLTGVLRFIVTVALGTAAIGALVAASGYGLRGSAEDEEDDAEEDEDADESRESWGAVLIGWTVHALLSLKARAIRLLIFLWTHRGALARSSEAPSLRRTEPRFDSPDRAAADEEETEDDEEEDGDEEDEDEEEDEEPVRKPIRAAAKPQARKSANGYVLPPLNLLAAAKPSDRSTPSAETIQENASALENVLEDFGVRGEIINARPGPVVTLYELEPAPGIKSSRVIGLADDIARSMSAVSARVAVVSGRNVIGIELPNPTREKVYLRELLASEDYNGSTAKLPLCLGKTIGGEAVIVDLARMPHLLIAGTTGSGKSVAINTMILSLVYRLTPDQCRIIMVDPKMLELSVYDGIPHLLTPVVTDPKKAVVALKWAVREMEERYKKMSKLGVRNIDGYNARVAEAKQRGETLTRTIHTGYDKETGEAVYEKEELELEPLPYIVVIVDEMADLMMVAGKDIEGAIQRLAQMARAAGLHVILATQRPSVDVITGTIKANFPTRISFQVTSKIDSRTILGEQGAEQLLGQGDMLYMAGGGRISRVHGPFCSDEEVEKVVRHLKAQGVPQYLEAVTADEGEDEDGSAVFDSTGMGSAEGGDLYQQAVQIVVRDRKASTSYIQRRLQIGYNRAASIMERMEEEGIVGRANHAGKREILVGESEERY